MNRGGQVHLLEIVEHEKEPPAAKAPGHRLERGLAGLLVQSEGPSDRAHDELPVPELRERDEEDSVWEAPADGSRQLQREPRLAGAARPG
jgi:hypothetical protein